MSLLDKPVIKKKPSYLALQALPIKVEFLVLHYTACSLKNTFKLFSKKHLYSHLIIDEKGTIYEVAPCLSKKTGCKKAFHAGASFWQFKGKTWKNFNDCSLGVELVNFNGNFFPFSTPQYLALASLMKLLKPLYPALKKPSRILGHEHISGYRGKVDPGLLFNWNLFFSSSYPEHPLRYPKRLARLSVKDLTKFQKKYPKKIPSQPKPAFPWEKLNLDLEHRAKSLNG